VGYARDFWAVNPNKPVVVVGNKVDLIEQRAIPEATLANLASQYRLPWFISSAKTGENVEAVFHSLGQQMLAG
jgi:50S ribosomal subunit-associated GTPase HflX